MGLRSFLRKILGRRAPARAAEEPDALEAYDVRVRELARRGAEVRRAVATLLVLRAELSRGRAAAAAGGRGPEVAELDAGLDRIEADATALQEVAVELEQERAALERERLSARVAVSSARAVARVESLRESERIRQVFELDAARDEVERLRALEALYREDRRARR